MKIAEQIPGFGAVVWIFNNWKLVAALASVGGLVYFAYLADKRGRERNEAVAMVASAQKTIDDLRAWHDATTAALERKVDRERDSKTFEANQDMRRLAAGEAGDGPLSPVLRDGMRAIAQRQSTRNNPR